MFLAWGENNGQGGWHQNKQQLLSHQTFSTCGARTAANLLAWNSYFLFPICPEGPRRVGVSGERKPVPFSQTELGRDLLSLLPLTHQTKGEVRRTKVTDGSASVGEETHVFLCAREGGSLWTGISDRGKSPLAKSQTRFSLNLKKGRKHYGDTFLHVTNISFHPHFVFSLLWPSSTRTGGGEGAAGTGNRSAESLDSADHQQLRVDVDRKEMRSRGGRQADAGSCSPTPLGSCLVPCCGPGAGARCRNGMGHPVGSRGLTLEYCAP